jgi:hypothetical protein
MFFSNFPGAVSNFIEGYPTSTFTNRLLYVQHVDKEKEIASEISKLQMNTVVGGYMDYLPSYEKRMLMKRFLEKQQEKEAREELISEILCDRNFSDYLESAMLRYGTTSNVDILKSSLQDQITHVEVYSNPLPATPAPTSDAAFQNTFVSFKTENLETKGEMWWSLEKNENNIILQQSPDKDDVTQKIYDYEQKELVQRHGPVKLLENARGNSKDLRYLLRAIWDTDHINTDDHVTFANCPNFTSFVFEKSNLHGKKWSILSDHIAKAEKLTDPLLYAQHVDKNKETVSIISQQSIREYFLGHGQTLSDTNFTEYLKNPKANVDILKSFLQDEITHVQVYTNPLPFLLNWRVTNHAYVVFKTRNPTTNEEMWWSLEKNTKYIVLQQSPVKDDVTEKLYDDGKKELVKRHGPVKPQKSAMGKTEGLEYLLRAIWETNQLNKDYHLLFANCQNFASFVFETANCEGKKWSTPISSFVEAFIFRNKKTNSISAQQI